MSDIRMHQLLTIQKLFSSLLHIIDAEDAADTGYAQDELQNNIAIIEQARADSSIDIDSLFLHIKKSYHRMYPPCGGLTDFFIWRENSDERIQANIPLDEITRMLQKIFK